MTASTPLCSSLDAYLDGELSSTESAAFETHAEACAECSAELAASRLLDSEWARLATTAAPPQVIASALREARRGTADRQPVAARRRRYGRLTGVVAFTLILVALASSALWIQRDAPPEPALQASTDLPTPTDTAQTTQPDLTPPEAPPAPASPSARPAPQQSPRSSPSRRQPARRAPPPPVEAPLQLAEDTSPDADTVAQAQEDLMLALALVADVQARAGASVSTEIERAAGALTNSRVF